MIAKDLELFKLSAKISKVDMVANEAKYQTVLLHYITNIEIFVRNSWIMTMKQI